MKKFTWDDLIVTTYLLCDEDTREQFKTWVLSMTHDVDKETGPGPDGTWNWVLENNATFDLNGPHATWIFIERETKKVVATTSFVPDDRGVAKMLGLKCLGISGFLNVHRDFRNRGLGTIAVNFRDKEIQEYVNSLREAQNVYFFSASPYAIKINERLGFADTGEIINLKVFGIDEQLYLKVYKPNQLVAKFC